MPRSKKHLLTTEQRSLFHAEIQRWSQILGMADWRIEPSSRPAARGAMADVAVDAGARLAAYRLGDFGQPPTPELISLTALHELLHVFLHDLVATARDHAKSDDDLEAAEHRVINVLEKIIGASK